MSSPAATNYRRWFVLAAIVAGGVVVWLRQPKPDPVVDSGTLPPPPSFPLPGYSPSPYLNTSAGAKYIGSAACAVCHPANHQSYLRTPHSKALSDVDPAAEPPDGAFRHTRTGRSYRVYRREGQLRHEEVLRNERGEEMARVDLPVRYLVGSGHYSRTYIVETEGYFFESPITWYASKKAWDTSPGYDRNPVSFTRPINLNCLVCHAGGVEEREGSVHRFNFREKAIGCENCHGPGSLHAELRRDPAAAAAHGLEDLTIVNPARLPRDLSEAICASCHLSDPAVVDVRGRIASDFRPGRPYSDYKIHYQFTTGRDRMTVVGHVEQLRLSACYQKSSSLTCITCHDPHSALPDHNATEMYRAKCLSCHAKQGCELPIAERLKGRNDDCVACHMPRGDTEIPHIAFTHHRIGIHRSQPDNRPMESVELTTNDDLSRLSALDRDRNLGLAYLHISRKPTSPGATMVRRTRATELLEHVISAGLSDYATALGLAELYWQEAPERATYYARKALEEKMPPFDRSKALNILFTCDFKAGNFGAAKASLDEITRIRLMFADWEYLGLCHLRENETAAALPALTHSLELNPFHIPTYGDMAETCRRLGDVKKAGEYEAKAGWLQQHNRR